MNYLSFDQAVTRLKKLDLLIYPTETFYAIGGSALNAQSVNAVYTAKERNKILPLPVIVGNLSQLEMLTEDISQDVETLINSFWPGPLTIIFPAKPELPRLLTAGTGRIAVRFSSHPAASRLALALGVPLVSSSANFSGGLPATQPEKIDPRLVEATEHAIYTGKQEPDGGQEPAGGLPSTIVEIVNIAGSGRMLYVLREGAIATSRFIELGFTSYIKS